MKLDKQLYVFSCLSPLPQPLQGPVLPDSLPHTLHGSSCINIKSFLICNNYWTYLLFSPTLLVASHSELVYLNIVGRSHITYLKVFFFFYMWEVWAYLKTFSTVLIVPQSLSGSWARKRLGFSALWHVKLLFHIFSSFPAIILIIPICFPCHISARA